LLFHWLGNGSSATDLTPALQLQAHCLLFTPEEQMRRDEADRVIESQQSRKPRKHVHCELSIGQKMVQVERFGRLLLGDTFRHVKQVFSGGGGLLHSANHHLVDAANREILKRMTPADESLIKDLKQIKAPWLHTSSAGRSHPGQAPRELGCRRPAKLRHCRRCRTLVSTARARRAFFARLSHSLQAQRAA
jgi:hypothetical protein